MIAISLIGSLLLCSLLETATSKSVPEEIRDANEKMNRVIMGMRDEMIGGFTNINNRMDQMEDMIASDAAVIEQVVKDVSSLQTQVSYVYDPFTG